MTELAGLVLALAAAMPVAQRTELVAFLAAGQGAVLAVAATISGFYPEAALLLLFHAAAIPFLVTRLAGPRRKPRLGPIAGLVAAAMLILLAAPISPALAVVLLGILTAWVARDRPTVVLALLGMQSGIALAGLRLAQPERLAVLIPVIPALACASLWMIREREG